MSLKLFIISAFQATIFGWMIWENVTMTTENERLRHKNHALNIKLEDIKEELRWYTDTEEIIDVVEKITGFGKKRNQD